MVLERTTSFSQNNLFDQCPRTWYMKYIQKIPGIEDLCYAHRGNVVHKTLEQYYPYKQLSIQELKVIFNNLWTKYKLVDTKLKNKKDESWLMVLNGVNLDLYVTSTELKIYFPDVVAYIDVVNSRDGTILDWKTSTISENNKLEYIKQLNFYSWLYYRKFNSIPKETKVFYLKYNGTRSELSHIPNTTDIKDAEDWHNDIRKRMEHYINHPDELPPFNKNYFFCPYKHLWDIEYKNKSEILNFLIYKYGNFFYIKGDMNEFLDDHFDKKYSYELKTAFFIKKHNPHANTTIHVYSRKLRRFPIGFFNEVIKSLYDYAEFRKKTPVIEIIDKKILDITKVEMPDKLLSGKILRPYQEDAVNIFVKRNDVCMFEIATGAGKSLCATEIVRQLGVKTLFVVDKKELLIQIMKTFKDNLGIEIGQYGAGIKDIKDITVATIQSLSKDLTKLKDYLRSVRFLITDECHKISAKSYYNLGAHMPNTDKRLGISATCFRDDKNDMMLFATTGRIKFSLSSEQLIADGYLMRPDIYFIKYDIDSDYEKMLENQSLLGLINEEPQYMLYYPNFIVHNKFRNNKIKEIVDDNEGKSILILVKLIEHGKLLEEMIPGSVYLYGETNKKKRESIFDAFKTGKQRILISTISIFAEGVDIPTLDVVINAAANKGDVKTIQVLGRVLRKSEGKHSATYYDFMDNYKFFRQASIARMKAFKSEGHSLELVQK